MTATEFLTNLLYSQYIARVPIPNVSAKGKTIIVTGSNTGLGREAVRHFVRLGAEKVIIACRSITKGEEAKKDILSTYPQSSTIIQVWHLDLGSYENIKAFARKASSELDRIDILVENAGIQTDKFRMIEQDEATITTNVVSTYLLALLLLPKLKETAAQTSTPPHLVIVSSDVHYQVDLSTERKQPRIFETLSDPATADMANRYYVSKLLEVLITRELVKRFMSTSEKSRYPIVFNLVTPGFCQSDLGREGGFSMKVMKFLFNARSTEKGSRTLAHAASAGFESHGQFLMDCQVKDPSKFVLSKEGAETQTRVWMELSEKLEGISPGILDVLQK